MGGHNGSTSKSTPNSFPNPKTSTESTDPSTSKGAPNSFPSPKTSTESTDPSTSKGAPNSFPSPKTSTESTDPLTSKGTPNSFPNPKTSTERTDPLTSKGTPNSFPSPKTSTESTDPSTSKGAPNSFPSPKTSTESTDPLTSKGTPNSFPNPKTSTERTDPLTSTGTPNSFPNPKTSTESPDPLISKGVPNSFPNPKTSTESTDPSTSKDVPNSFPNPKTSTESTDPLTSKGTPNCPPIYSGRGKRINESRKVKGTSDLASTSRDYNNATQRSYQNLSLSVQQVDSNGREYISLSNKPPRSVATTLYNNYKLLLLSLAQRLPSYDIVKLKDWAAQNFSIENPQNAREVFFRLDQKGIIHASDLSQLRDFFESIVRFDLVHTIDAFLLGDYSLLRQTLRRTRTITQQGTLSTTTSSRIPRVAPNEINNAQLPSQPHSVNENQAREVANLRSSHNSDNGASPSGLPGQSTGEVSIIK